MHNIQAVLLDMDGTLVDAFAPIVRALNQTLQEFGLEPLSERDIRRHTGKGDCSMRALFGTHQEEAGQRFLEIHDEDYFTGIKPLEGADTLLTWLQHQQIPAAVVTSKGQHRAEAQLAHLDWGNQFQCVIGKLEGRASKPDPETLLLACEHIGIQPQYAIMIGDGLADIKAAKRAGCLALGMHTSFSHQELTDAGAVHTFSTLTEVQAWLKMQIH